MGDELGKIYLFILIKFPHAVLDFFKIRKQPLFELIYDSPLQIEHKK